MGIKNILFVCTGNTCRSCMAEAIFRNAAGNLGHNDNRQVQDKVTVRSAGVSVFCSEEASDNAVKVMEEWGIDLRQHRSRQLTEDMIRDADLILAMTRSHKGHILNIYPQYKDKVYTLKEYVSERESSNYIYDYSLDIPDPFGGNIESYRKCAEEIKLCVEKVINRIFF